MSALADAKYSDAEVRLKARFPVWDETVEAHQSMDFKMYLTSIPHEQAETLRWMEAKVGVRGVLLWLMAFDAL